MKLTSKFREAEGKEECALSWKQPPCTSFKRESCRHQHTHTTSGHWTSGSCHCISHICNSLTPSTWASLMSVSSPLRLSGSVLVTGRRRTGWPETSWTRWVTKAERTQDGLQNQGLRSHTADERTLRSTQGLNAGPPRQDLHPEPALLLCRDLWWCGRPPMVPQQLGPSSFSYIWRYLTCTPTCLIRASYTYEQNFFF